MKELEFLQKRISRRALVIGGVSLGLTKLLGGVEAEIKPDGGKRGFEGAIWFSTGYPLYNAGDLFDEDNNLTPLGERWRQAIEEAPTGLVFGVGNCSKEDQETLNKILCQDPERCVWFNWGYRPEENYQDSRFVPMVFRFEETDYPVAYFAEKYPGRTWLIFNEPDLDGQADITPKEGAIHYAYLYDQIMTADPTATLLVGGMAFMNYGWLEEFLQFQRDNPGDARPIHGVHVHAYPCSQSVSWECVGSPKFYSFYERYRLDIVKEKALRFMAWMESWPELKGKPVWITEAGIISNKIYDPGPEKVRDKAMNPFLDWFNSQEFKQLYLPILNR